MNGTDLVILGGGPGGYACAFRAAQLGLSVVLVERDKLGGTCLHRGCIPTKALLHTAEVADTAREGVRIGVKSSLAGIDLGAVGAYKDSVVDRLRQGLRSLADAHRITFVKGTGALVAPGTVEVDGRRCAGRHVVLATGSYARSLPGVDPGGPVVTSDQALALTSVPDRVIVLGGGVIGVEFTSLWRSFGAEVTIVEALPGLLATEDTYAAKQLARAFRRRGIKVKTKARVATVDRTAPDGVSVTLESGDVLSADLLLIAVGRAPNTVGHGYEESGVALDRGFVVTDDRLRTSLPGVRAVGDLVSGPQLAHRGFQHGIFVAEDIAGLDPSPVQDTAIPRVTYCTPEVASIGLTEHAATDAYGTVETVTYDLAGNGRSQILGASGGIKLIRAPHGAIVGVTMVGDRVGELIGEAQVILGTGATAKDLASLVHAHPTQNEALGEALLAMAGKPLHAHA
ncbi:dihydrolipoyl dehydrogenase [Streptomyces niger]|uniref:dihydrolipoyl dehydrogenase n=1 Tax=Streptomyces niger TaxID=66373 RepID=UPI00069C8A40|nr:dihydrolipoyl dehydrogenase [Streptomyces niger]